MRHRQDGRHVRVAPVDRERKAGLQDHHGVLVGRVDLAHQRFLLEVDPLAIDRFLAVARDGTLLPSGIAGRMVADDDDRQVGLLRQRRGGAGGVIGRKPDLHSIAGRLADSVERRHGVGRSAAVPIR